LSGTEILILGSEGFIGSNLIHYFLSKDVEVKGIDHLDNPTQSYKYFKSLSISEFYEILRDNKFKCIINAAGSGNVGYSIDHPLGDFEANCFQTTEILDAIRVTKSVAAYMHISSAAVYGNPQRLPVKEEDDLKPLSPYGWHKYISEILCREYFECFSLRSCIIRPFSVYGPGLKKQLFWDIYNKASASANVELFGTGDESRDFIYIDDLVRLIGMLVDKAEMKAECYNVANGTEVTIRNSARLFLNNFSSKVNLQFTGQIRSGDPLRWCADISKIKSLGYKPQMDMIEGLRQTYSWIKKYQEGKK
jgi:UDP-glucose 4-epimerase